MKVFGLGGLGWGGIEHRWERRTNHVLLIGLFILFLFCISKYLYPIKTLPEIYSYGNELGFILIFIAFAVHSVARTSHIIEKHKMKNNRPWENK